MPHHMCSISCFRFLLPACALSGCIYEEEVLLVLGGGGVGGAVAPPQVILFSPISIRMQRGVCSSRQDVVWC